MFMIVYLRIGVRWKLVALRTPLQEYLIYPTMDLEWYNEYA
jgi:hypothetical protein